MNITGTFNIPAQPLCDWIVTCVEGGSNYWCEELNIVRDGKPVSYQEASSYEGENWFISVIDAEESGEARATPQDVSAAFSARLTDTASLLDGSYDAGVADAPLQQAVHGDIIYG